MDRGIATEDRVKWLVESGYRYVVVSWEQHREFDAGQAIDHKTRTGGMIHLQRKESEDGQEVRLWCHSPQREEKERAIVERFGQRFEKALEDLSDRLSRPRARRTLERVQERVGRIKEKSLGVSRHYEVEVMTDDTGTKATGVRWTRNPVEGTIATHPGVYCLRTNIMEWDESTLWRTYSMLTDLESVFRSLKSELGLRPIFHRKEKRTEGHLFITVIAYQAVQMIRACLAARGEKSSWNTLRNILAGQQRVTTSFRRKDKRKLHVRSTTKAEPEQREIYDALGISAEPGGVRRTVI